VPAGRRVFADATVDGLTDQVRVPGVPAVFLNQVAYQPTQAGMVPVRSAGMGKLVKPAIGQGGGERRARPRGGGVPDGVELLRRVGRCGVELPVGIGCPVHGVPGRGMRRAAQLGGKDVMLGEGEVFEQAAKGQRRGADAGTQPCLVQVVSLPAKGCPQPFERTDKLLGLTAASGGSRQ
jgi:hypothetical protein